MRLRRSDPRLPNASFVVGHAFIQLRATPTLKVGPYKLGSVITPLDKVWHTELLAKLRSYLQNRHFLVKVGTEHANPHEINAGVPQGSVLRPLLYLIYTAGLSTKPEVLVSTFADDIVVLAADNQPAVAS